MLVRVKIFFGEANDFTWGAMPPAPLTVQPCPKPLPSRSDEKGKSCFSEKNCKYKVSSSKMIAIFNSTGVNLISQIGSVDTAELMMRSDQYNLLFYPKTGDLAIYWPHLELLTSLLRKAVA